MNEQFPPEILTQARAAETPEALLALAQEHGVTLTPEEAQARFDQLHQTGALADEELDNVAGGGCGDPKPKFNVGDRVTFAPGCESSFQCKYCAEGDSASGTPPGSPCFYATVTGRKLFTEGWVYDVACRMHGQLDYGIDVGRLEAHLQAM